MPRLNRTREEIEHYFATPRYSNPQDRIRGRLNYVGGWETWRASRIALDERETQRRADELENMARYNAYFAARGRGRGRGRGRDGRNGGGRGREEGRGSNRRGYENRGENYDIRERGEERNEGRGDGRGRNDGRSRGRGRGQGSGRGTGRGRNENSNNNGTGESNEIERRSVERNEYGIRTALSNVNATRAYQANQIDHEVWNSNLQIAIETSRVDNPYRDRTTDVSQDSNRGGRNDNTEPNQQPRPSLPVAEMRSNDAPQDDSIPVGDVIGLVNGTTQGPASSPDAITSETIREARMDSRARNRLAQVIHPEPTRPRGRAASGNNNNSRVIIPEEYQNSHQEALREIAATHPLSVDESLNIWVHPNGHLVFENGRSGGSPEFNVMTRRVLENHENFRTTLLSTLSSYDRWQVLSSVAPLMVSIHVEEPINRYAIFVSHFFITCSLQDLQDMITKQHVARRVFRKYKTMKHFILTAKGAFPLINPDIVSKSALTKIQASASDPICSLELMKAWATRCYHYHVPALINQINTYVDPARLRGILNTPGEYHEWAIEVVPGAIFCPPAPLNIMHIYDSVVEVRDSRLEQQSLQEVLDIENDLPVSEDIEQKEIPNDGYENETALTGTYEQDQGQSQEITMVEAELIPEDQVTQILNQVHYQSARASIDTGLQNAEITNALEIASQEGTSIVLAGLYGAPLSVEGFTVVEYINLDAPLIAPIEAYPQTSNTPYADAVDNYIRENYMDAKKDIRARMKLFSEEQIEALATRPGKLEQLIQNMQLRKYTPDPKWTTRCNGKYQIVANDPALLLSDGVDYTNLIQVAIKSTELTDTFIEELRIFGEIFAPEHRFQLGEIRRVMPNLTEQPLQADGDNKVIRIRIETSFCLNNFMAITELESKIVGEWLSLIEKYTSESKVVATRPVHFKAIAIFPGLLPENDIDEIKNAILRMGSVRETPNEIAMDWTNENTGHITESNFAVLYTQSTSSLSRIVTESPISLTSRQVQGISINEVDDLFHQEAILQHSNRMTFQQALIMDGVPTWSVVDVTTIHPPTNPGDEDYSDLSIATYFKRYQSDGTIGDPDTALFSDVTVGQISSKIVLTIPLSKVQLAMNRLNDIQRIFQETIGPMVQITAQIWPEIEAERNAEVDPPRNNPSEEPQKDEEQAQDFSNEKQEHQTQQEVQDRENEPWESAHAQVGLNIQEEVIGLKQAIETLTKVLTAKESLTAPLTIVTATSNGEVSPVSSISIAELTVAIHDAFEKAYNEGGFLYKATEEDNKRLADCIVEMLRDSIKTTTPIMQETVRESVEEGSIHIQQKVMESIQDTSSGLLRMITNPSKEHAGEIALITKSHLAPYFETLAKAVSRLAVLLEVATNSPEHAALGNAQMGITPTYTLLMDIKQLLRTIQYQISSGQKALNRAVMDIETSLAQEIRINNENEAMARDYTRRLMKMKHMTLQKIKNQSGETKNQAMVDLIEQGLDLQIEFQEQYCGLTNPDEWRIREPMNNSEDESQNQEPDDVIEEEKAPSIVKRKSPEKQPVMEAHCESVSVAEVQEELEAIEEAEVEMAIKMSMQDLEIQPLDDLQSQIAEEAHDTKPAALSNEELAKMKKHEEDLLAQEQVRRQEEQEQIERDVAELLPENTSILNKNEKGTVSAQKENTNSPTAKVQESKGDQAYKEEVVPGTPLMKMNPNVVTPKDLKTKVPVKEEDANNINMRDIVAEAQQEVSNLTTPNTLGGPTTSMEPHESDLETVTDGTNETDSSEKKHSSEQNDSVSSRTRRSKLKH